MINQECFDYLLKEVMEIGWEVDLHEVDKFLKALSRRNNLMFDYDSYLEVSDNYIANKEAEESQYELT